MSELKRINKSIASSSTGRPVGEEWVGWTVLVREEGRSGDQGIMRRDSGVEDVGQERRLKGGGRREKKKRRLSMSEPCVEERLVHEDVDIKSDMVDPGVREVSNCSSDSWMKMNTKLRRKKEMIKEMKRDLRRLIQKRKRIEVSS